MKISIKNLKGEVFTIEAETTDKVSALKSKIQAARSDLVADRQKLIHSGKVLKDEQDVGELNLGESDFIVCMVTKEAAKKPTSAAPTNTVPPATPAAPLAPAAPVAPVKPTVQATPTTATSTTPSVNSEALQALVNMGFPEADARVALTAAMGNPDVAYEFLLSGIPENLIGQSSGPATTSPPSGSGEVSIEQLRQHPQFNMLKQLVQQNPAALPQVLDLIGQQSPALYTAIQNNNDAFIAMMNEPISDSPAPVSSLPAAPVAPVNSAGGLAGALSDPGQVMQLLAGLPPQQRAQFAQSAGINPQELEELLLILNSIPAEHRQQFLGGAMGALGGGMGGRSPAHVVRLTEEEMAAVTRLTELGFTRQQAAQAYLACDKDEQLAANFLLGGGFDDDMQDFGGDDGGDDHDEDMYG